MSSVAEVRPASAGRVALDARVIAAAYVLLSLVGLVGLSLGTYPFAVDLPNHAARLFIECNPGDPVLSRMYSIHYDLIPNLAIDFINRPFCGLADPMTVIRTSTVAVMAGILLVVWLLHRLLNDRPNAFVLLAPGMTLNIVTSMGYLNYQIGTFLFLAFAYVALRYRLLERHPVLAIIVPNAFGALIFLCHVFALALAGIFAFGVHFRNGVGRPVLQRVVSAGLKTAAAFAVPLVMMVLAERSGFGAIYLLAGKLRMLWAPMLFSSVLAAAALAFVWTALFYWAFREKLVTFAPAVRWPLAFLTAFAVLLPSALLNAVDLDSRSLVSVAYLAIAALGMREMDGAKSRQNVTQIVAAGVVMMTLGAQLFFSLPQIRVHDAQIAEYRRASSIIEPGSSVLTLRDTSQPTPSPHQFYAHLASYTTVDRKIFNPFEFTGKGMQPMSANPEFACIDVPGGMPIPLPIATRLVAPGAADLVRQRGFTVYAYAQNWNANFDFVVSYHFGASTNPFPRLLTPVHEGSFFTIYRTNKPLSAHGPCAASTPAQ